MDREPSLYVGAITAFLTAAVGALAAFGLHINDDQRNAVIACVAPTVALVVIMSAVIRQLVYSPHSVQAKVDEAASKGATGETPTPVVP